jgi:phage-related protein
MKATCLLVVILGLFTATHAITDELKELGTTVVNTLVEKGKELLTTAAADFLQKLLSSNLIGKREVVSVAEWLEGVTNKLKALADKGKEVATGIFSETLKKLKALTDAYHTAIGSVTDASDITSQIDTLVADHHAKQKRVLGDLLNKGKELLSGAYEKAQQVLAKLKEHASNLVSGALQKGADILVGKRALTDHLQAIGDVLNTAVGPFKDIVSNLGETLKGHFSNLVDTVKGHADALTTKLSPHVDDLKGHGQKLLEHGKNALGALSEVVSDILNQTLTNAKDSLGGVSQTLQEAGKTVVGHFSGTDGSSTY